MVAKVFPSFPNKISSFTENKERNLRADVQRVLYYREWINARTNSTCDRTRVLGVVAAGKGAENYLPYTVPKAIQQIAEIGLGADIVIGLNNGFECQSVTDGFNSLPNVQVIHLYTGEKATNATPAQIFENSARQGEPYYLNNISLLPNQHRIFVVHQNQGLHSPGKIRVLGDIYGSLILGSIDRGWIPPAFTVAFDAESLFLVSRIGMPPELESNGLRLIINELKNNLEIDVLGANNRYVIYQKKQVNTTEVLLPDFDVDLPPTPWFLNVLHGQYRGFLYKPASCTVGKTDAIASLFAAMAERCPGTRIDDAHLTILAQYAGFPGGIFMDVVSTNRVPKLTDMTTDEPPKLAWIEQLYRWMTSLQGLEKHYGKFPVDSICTTSFPWNVAIDPIRFIKRALQLEKLTFKKLMRNLKSLVLVFWVFLKLKKRTIENADVLHGSEAKASW